MGEIKKSSMNENLVTKQKSKKTKMKKYSKRETIMGYLFASPWIIGFVVLMAFPLFYSLYLSFTNATTTNMNLDFRGLDYYKVILQDPNFWESVGNTIKFVCISVPLNLLFALYLAMLLNTKVRGRKFFRALYYIPTLVTIVAVVFLWKQLLGSSGVVNEFLGLFGIEGPDWFHDYTWATPGLAIMGMWSVGGTVVIFLSSLTDVPVELYEAIAVDGGNAFTKFKSVTLPSISPILFYNLLTSTIGAFQIFVQPMLMTGGEYNTNYLGYYIYQTGFTVGRQGYASAMSWLMLCIVGVFVILIQLARKKWAFYND
ncbi:carbohydrate ABC transporter permease [Lachnoclostridium sp.]|uniref:carbohydrate ABC transporter permease n=1 Tax=Lachnoclostridium sp. TaxID=2028282 RepID=UPI0028A10F6F|nr:sugar ABC transporter permease [Lachnoclostridium sp.]